MRGRRSLSRRLRVRSCGCGNRNTSLASRKAAAAVGRPRRHKEVIRMTRLASERPETIYRSVARWLDGINLADPALAATLELLYLRPFLAALPPDQRAAVDVGAHRGHVAAELLDLDFRVLAVEPQNFLADHLTKRF